MSLLSKITGIGISRKGVKIDPLKAALTVGGFAVGLPALQGIRMATGAGVPLTSALKAAGQVGLSQAGKGALAAGGFLKNNIRTIADVGKVGEGIYDRVQENKAIGQANDRYRSLSPIREQAMRDLMAQPAAINGNQRHMGPPTGDSLPNPRPR